MASGYWKVEFITPESPGDGRCVLLHGQLEETVGPMTIEMAEAWIDRFDNRQPASQPAPMAKPQEAPSPSRNAHLPRPKTAS